MRTSKSLFLIPLIILVLILGGTSLYAEERPVRFTNKNVKNVYDIKVFVDNQPLVFDTPIKMSEGRTLVPLRKIAEALDFDVSYNSETRNINLKSTKLKSQNLDINLYVDSEFATVSDMQYIGDVSLALDVVPEVYDKRTYVPLRIISELCEASIEWNPKTRRIDIHSVDKSQDTIVISPDDSPVPYDYTGRLVDGKPNGFGVLFFGAERSYYKGEWKNGLPHGSGILKWTRNGEVFVVRGEFKDGRMQSGTVIRSYGFSLMSQGKVLASYGAAGAGFYVLPKDDELENAWLTDLLNALPKIQK